MVKKSINAQLKEVNARIDSVSVYPAVQSRGRNSGYIMLSVFIGAILFAGIYFGVGSTGFVTFSESVFKSNTYSFSVIKSGQVNIRTDLDSINSLLLSGTVHGNGKAAVFLVKPDRNYLAYYFEGDAKEGLNFSDMCYDTCHIEGLGRDNVLEFQLEGTRIDISKVTYIYDKLIDFALEPRTTIIEYDTEPAKVINLHLTNTQNSDFSVLLYVDGPLSSSFSWQGSLIHMTANDSEKIVPVMVKLPSNLPAGEYTNRITARYVPPGNYDFVGESPIAESFVTVVN